MDGLTNEERAEELLEFLSLYWGNMDKETFAVHADKLFGGLDNFETLCVWTTTAAASADFRAIGSLLIAALNASYEIGRRSLLQ